MLFLILIYMLLSMAVAVRRDKSILYSRISLISLLLIIIISYNNYNIIYLTSGVGLFGGYFQTSSLIYFLHQFLFIISLIIFQLTSFYPRKIIDLNNKYNYLKSLIYNKLGETYKIIEYSLILIFIITGASFLMSSCDIISLFICLELQSYGLYLLATIYRNSELSTSAGLLYFLLGGFSSCFILLGTGLLYANSGATNLEGYYLITNLIESSQIKDYFILNVKNYINYSLLLISVGFLFKLSAAPFHFWSPDVYDAIPTVVTTFVAIVAKISLFIFLLEIVNYTKSNDLALNWTYSLLYSTLLSLLIGTILGLSQSRIKRLFAYSTISHIGFILLALALNTMESCQAFIFYLVQYSLANLNGFILLITIGYSFFFFSENNKKLDNSTEEIKEQNNSPVQLIDQFKGYFFKYPLLSVSFAITIYSFVGIPPLIGFFAKQMVLSACLDKGYYLLALIAILTSVISAVYYLKIIQKIFMEEDFNFTKFKITFNNYSFNYDNIYLANNLTLTISLITLIILLFLFYPQELLDLTLLLSFN